MNQKNTKKQRAKQKRNLWTMKPITRIKTSKKVYDRKRKDDTL